VQGDQGREEGYLSTQEELLVVGKDLVVGKHRVEDRHLVTEWGKHSD